MTQVGLGRAQSLEWPLLPTRPPGGARGEGSGSTRGVTADDRRLWGQVTKGRARSRLLPEGLAEHGTPAGLGPSGKALETSVTLVVTISLDSYSVRCHAVPLQRRAPQQWSERQQNRGERESSLRLCHPVWTPRRSYRVLRIRGYLRERHLSWKETNVEILTVGWAWVPCDPSVFTKHLYGGLPWWLRR